MHILATYMSAFYHNNIIAISILLQLYPFGSANGDATLSYPSSGEGSSSAITLTKSLYFYDDVIRTAYVS